MTVQQLIDKLMVMPRDAVVIRDFCSEYDNIPDDDPKLILADEQKVVIRNGMYMGFNPRHWPKDESPEFVTVVHFAGN